jgi:ABC-type multidrug transport system fused ATPase/permease subunit
MNDLHIIADKFEAFSYEIDSATYKIDFLNLSFNVLQINTNKISYVPLESLSINIDNSFKKFGEQYILEELMKMSFYEKEGEVNASLKSKDIDVIFSHFVDLTKEKNAVTMTSKFQGDGGILILQLEFTPFKKSVESVLIALSKIFSIIVGLTLVTLIVIKFKLYWIFTGFFFVGFIFVFYLLALIPGEISKIYKSIIQIKRYGKQ